MTSDQGVRGAGYVDAHTHLWDLSEGPQTWMDLTRMSAILRNFSADDLRASIEGTGVAAAVAVQPLNDAGDTERLLARAARSPLIAGVVAWADLTSEALADRIAELREGPGGDKLVGLRHLVQDEPDPLWLDRPDVRRGLAAVADAGLAFDLLVVTRQLSAAIRTVRALPHARFVLDHLAKPPLATGRLDPWLGPLRELAAEPNVMAKVSGLVTEADWNTWTVEGIAPAVDVAVEAFGAERLMFGSDWPVCLLAATYPGVVQAAEKLLAGLSADEHRAVFSSNARRFYRLGSSDA